MGPEVISVQNDGDNVITNVMTNVSINAAILNSTITSGPIVAGKY